MNPFWLLKATIRQDRRGFLLLSLLIALSLGLGVAVLSQERALRKGSAQAAADFDLLIGAPGSPTQLLLSAVYLQPRAVSLISSGLLTQLQSDSRVEFAAPLAFGDSWKGRMIVGTTEAFVTLGGARALLEGRSFREEHEAVVGAKVALALGESFVSQHGTPEEVRIQEQIGGTPGVHDSESFTVVGRLPVQGTPWDWAILVPVEAVWHAHGLSGSRSEFGGALGSSFQAPVELDEGASEQESNPGVPAIVVKPRGVAEAYQLRATYRTGQTQAFFPAEVLVELYQTLGDVRDAMSLLAWATQVLVIAAVWITVLMTLELKRSQLALLRAFGASRGFLFLGIWLHVEAMVLTGVVLGLGLGWLGAWGLSWGFAQQSGLFLPVRLSWPELQMALILLASGGVLGLLPGWSAYRRSVREALQTIR
jgi:putative ABC transport system permease protein